MAAEDTTSAPLAPPAQAPPTKNEGPADAQPQQQPASKRAKTDKAAPLPASVVVQFQSTQGESTGPQVDLPTDSTPAQLELLINELRRAQGQDGEDALAVGKVPYSCYVNDVEVTDSLRDTLEELGVSSEGVITVSYQPLAVFRVRPVVRCTDTMPGHTEVGARAWLVFDSIWS